MEDRKLKKDLEEALRKEADQYFSLRPLSGRVYALSFPSYYGNGDMADIFLDATDPTSLRLTDKGFTLMRLSGLERLDQKSVEKNVGAIVRDRGLDWEGGVFSLACPPGQILPTAGSFSQALAEIVGLVSIDRNTGRSIFLEDFDHLIRKNFQAFKPKKDYQPIEEEGDYRVDYLLKNPFNGQEVFLYAVANDRKAKEVISSLLFFQWHRLSFRGVLVFDDPHDISSRDLRRLKDVGDWTYSSLADFGESGLMDLQRSS